LKFGVFVGATFVMACGLSQLETVANPYIALLGDPESASFRLTMAQGFNGVGFVFGPLIASRAFFNNIANLKSVQYVYLGIAVAVGSIAVGFLFAKIPEISDKLMLEQAIASGDQEIASRPLHKQRHLICGFIAQFIYVAAQVTLATFFINYVTEIDDISDAFASNLLSVGLAAFTIGRFASCGLMMFIKPRHIITIYGFMATLLCSLTIGVRGIPGVVICIAIFFFESCMFPTIFTLAIRDLGANTKKGSSLMIMAVSGGAAFPPIQGAIADAIGTPKSQCVPMVGYCIVMIYALFLAEPVGKKQIHRDSDEGVEKIHVV
jgi:MFS transporter, FHS family, L-fucose permease